MLRYIGGSFPVDRSKNLGLVKSGRDQTTQTAGLSYMDGSMNEAGPNCG